MRISDWSSDVCSSDLKAAVGLSETIFRTFCENGVQAVHERGGGGFHYVHILTYSTRTNNEFTAMAKKLVKSEQPFALGAHATMLSPAAWAIIRGLTFYGFGRVGVETGNAACGKPIGSASCRERVCTYVVISGVADS